MTAEWATSMTFGEGLKRLAEAAGFLEYPATAGSTGELPSDPVILDKLKRRYNDGWERFLRARARWTFMRQVFELTTSPEGNGPYNVDNDASRYRLPRWLHGAQPNGNWHYTDTSALYDHVVATSWERVRAAYAGGGNQSGAPQLAACRRSENPQNPALDVPGWEVVFWPKPGAAYSLAAMFDIVHRIFVDLDEHHPAGSRHDQTIVACAKFEWFKDDLGDPTKKADAAQEMSEAIARSIEIDRKNEPARLGRVTDPGMAELVRTGRLRRDDRAGVTTVNGIDVATSPYT